MSWSFVVWHPLCPGVSRLCEDAHYTEHCNGHVQLSLTITPLTPNVICILITTTDTCKASHSTFPGTPESWVPDIYPPVNMISTAEPFTDNIVPQAVLWFSWGSLLQVVGTPTELKPHSLYIYPSWVCVLLRHTVGFYQPHDTAK